MPASVVVIGSINQDVTVTVDRFPQPGETLPARSLSYRLGGKGANQAAAAAHAGARARFIGRVGSDAAGPALREELAGHGVDVTGLLVDEGTTGSAFITVSATGENTILIDAGANGRVDSEQAARAVTPGEGDVVVLQGEIPAAANTAAIASARYAGATTILNLAPVYDIAADDLAAVDILVVNETEAGLVLSRPAPSGAEDALAVAARLAERGPRRVLVTLGAAGAVWYDAVADGGPRGAHVEAVSAGPVVDTTGAGDACVGALAAALALGLNFERAVVEAMRAGSTAVLSAGAAASYGAISAIGI
ncbi:PfkB family carbohydrate kinase [Actinomyces sp.]|uniref:PfkB family carbohydrate kinase n=1 Tax=Actinomyces sp. TaxID=29317 RepID=UPI0026DCFF9E|nr:PfkB family carbohydrate kinase [Actinomyces sp.]MDO4901079.1 PfkB family carbohydrate kinase [Actinomyces sp.]